MEANQNLVGIDLTTIQIKQLDLGKDTPKNPVDRKIYFAKEMFSRDWDVLAVLYLQQAISLLKNNVVKDFANKDLLMQMLEVLKHKEQLDEESIEYLETVQAAEIREKIALRQEDSVIN